MKVPSPCHYCSGPTEVRDQVFRKNLKSHTYEGFYLRQCRACLIEFTGMETFYGTKDIFRAIKRETEATNL